MFNSAVIGPPLLEHERVGRPGAQGTKGGVEADEFQHAGLDPPCPADPPVPEGGLVDLNVESALNSQFTLSTLGPTAHTPTQCPAFASSVVTSSAWSFVRCRDTATGSDRVILNLNTLPPS